VQVTDDLFDEIAQEVMDEDEQRLLEGLTIASGFILECMLMPSCIYLSPHKTLLFTSWHFLSVLEIILFRIFTFLTEIWNQNLNCEVFWLLYSIDILDRSLRIFCGRV